MSVNPDFVPKLKAELREEHWLKHLFLKALGTDGNPLPEPELNAYLPRITILTRKKSMTRAELTVVVLDYDTLQERYLFGFGEARYHPTAGCTDTGYTYGYGFVRPLLSGSEALAAARS